MKYINLTPEAIEEMCNKLRTQLQGSKALSNNITVSMPINQKLKDEEKPTVIVSTLAERKMNALIQQCSDEVAWHGTVSRDKDSNTYFIEDIFVFPQEVTGATATGVDGEYETWLMGLDDEAFNKLRFHGHSHVRMGTAPSATDLNYQENLLEQVEDFYIFGIYNKLDKYTLSIYDVESNMLYETDDIFYDSEINEVLFWADKEIKDKVSKKVFLRTYGNTPTPDKKDKKETKAKDKKTDKVLSAYEKANKELKPNLYYGGSYSFDDYGYDWRNGVRY